MTAAEALARAIVTKRDWNDSELSGVLATIVEKYSETIARLRALGFAIVPVEADEATVERIAAAIWERWRVSAVAPAGYGGSDMAWPELKSMATRGGAAARLIVELAADEAIDAYAAMVGRFTVDNPRT